MCNKRKSLSILDCDLPIVLNFSCIILMSLKSKLKKTADLLNETLNEHCHQNSFLQGF